MSIKREHYSHSQELTTNSPYAVSHKYLPRIRQLPSTINNTALLSSRKNILST